MNVKEGVDEMITYLANEPSVGLFFVQQHAQASMPYLLSVKDKVVEKVHDVTLHTEDTEDSIDVVRSMTQCGLPIADDMIKDINRSLLVMSTSQPKKGLIPKPSWGFQSGSSSSNMPAAFDYNAGVTRQNGGSSRGYLSAVFSSAKQKASGLRWSQPDPLVSVTQPPSAIEANPLSTVPDAEADELPLSSQLVDVQPDEADAAAAESSHCHDMSSMLESYVKFKSDRETKLEAWLQES